MINELQDLELLEHLEEAKKVAAFLNYGHSVNLLREAIVKAKYPEGLFYDFMKAAIEKDSKTISKTTSASSEDLHLLLDSIGARSRREQRYIEGQRADLARRVCEAERSFPRHLLAIKKLAQAQKNTDLVSLTDNLLTIRSKEDDTREHDKYVEGVVKRSDEIRREVEELLGRIDARNKKKPPPAGGPS